MRQKLAILICTTILLNVQNTWSATISGCVSGNTEKQIEVFYPFNGFTTVRLIQEKTLINLDSSNSFSCHLDILHPCFITLYIDYNPVDLFVDDTSDLFLQIHLDSITKTGHANWLKITGKYSKGNVYFNDYNFYPSTKYIGVTDFFSSVQNYDVSYLKQSIDSLVNIEQSHFDSLVTESIIDSTFWRITSKEIQALLYFEIIRHPLTRFDERRKMPNDEIRRLITWLFSKCDPLDPDLLFGLNSNLYTEYYFLVKTLERENKGLYQKLNDSTITVNSRSYTVSGYYRHLLEVPDKRLKENLWGNVLSSYQNHFKGFVTRNDVNVFRFYFPNSKWLPYLNAATD